MRKLKIVSGGTDGTTFITDAETGERIENVIAVRWQVASQSGAHGIDVGVAIATLTLFDVAVEVEGVEVAPTSGEKETNEQSNR